MPGNPKLLFLWAHKLQPTFTSIVSFLGFCGFTVLASKLLPLIPFILLALAEFFLLSALSVLQQPALSIPLLYIAYTLYRKEQQPQVRNLVELVAYLEKLDAKQECRFEAMKAMMVALNKTTGDKDLYEHLEEITILSRDMASLIEDFTEVQSAVMRNMKGTVENFEAIVDRFAGLSVVLEKEQMERRELRSYMETTSRTTTVLEEENLGFESEYSSVGEADF